MNRMTKNNETLYEYVKATEGENEVTSRIQRPQGFGVRHGQCLLLFLSLCIGYMIRSHLSVTMVAMTAKRERTCLEQWENRDSNHTELYYANVTDIVCNQTEELGTWNIYRSYEWNKSKQEMIMFSFFLGYTCSNFPMGIVVQRYGGKIPIVVFLFVNGITSIITPWATLFGGWITFCAIRLIQGITQATIYPSIHTMLGKWAPLEERGRLSTLIYTGSSIGVIMVFQVAGLVASSPLFGWPSTFWLCGLISIITGLLTLTYVTNSPYDHKHIQYQELAYIVGEKNVDTAPKKRKTPWTHIVRSKAVWSVIIAHSGSIIGYLCVLTQIPTYMSHVLHVNIKQNGLLSSLPHLAMAIGALLAGVIADYCANNKILKLINIRRIANTIGLVLCSLMLVPFVFVTTTWIAVLCLICSMALHSGIMVGFHINHIDLSPNFAGPLMALGNTIANLCSLSVPVIVTSVVGDDLSNQARWQLLIGIVLGVLIAANTIYVIFAKAEVQPWNYLGTDDDNDYDEKPMDSTKLPMEVKSDIAEN